MNLIARPAARAAKIGCVIRKDGGVAEDLQLVSVRRQPTNGINQHVHAFVPRNRAHVADTERFIRASDLASAEQRDDAIVRNPDSGRGDAQILKLPGDIRRRGDEPIDVIEHAGGGTQAAVDILRGDVQHRGATRDSREPTGQSRKTADPPHRGAPYVA